MKYLLYIGVLEPRRNILFLLDLFKRICESKENYQLVIIGRGKPEYTQTCLKKMKELGIEDKVIYRQQLEQKYLKAVYEIADAFLLPTRYEIFGMVLLEAMYFGLPVFTTYNGGSSTLMTGENGIVIPKLDINTWANEIITLLDDPRRVKRITKNAKKTIEEEYTWDILADAFLGIYQRRLNSGKQSS